MTSPSDQIDVDRLIDGFGGVRPTATALGVAVSTVQGWKARGRVPESRAELVMETAQRAGIDVRPVGKRPPPSEPHEDMPQDRPIAPDRPLRVGQAEAEHDHDDHDDHEDYASEDAGRRGGGFSTFLAFVALIAAGVAISMPFWPPEYRHWETPVEEGDPGAPALAALDGRIETLDSRLSALAERPVGDGGAAAAALADQIKALETRIAALESREVVAPARLGEVQAEALEASRRALDEALSGLRSRSDALETGVTELTSRVGVLESAPEDPRLDSLSAEIAAANGAVDAFDRRLGAVQDTLKAHGQLLEASRDLPDLLETARSDADQAAETAATAALRGERALGEIGALDARMGTLGARVSALETRSSLRRSASPRDLALILAAGQFRDAVIDGRPYAAELEALDELLAPVAALRLPGGDTVRSVLDGLRPFANQGVPTARALQSRFPRTIPEVLRAARLGVAPGDEGADPSWTAQVRANLADLVTIRPSGETDGYRPADVLARAEARLAEDDLDGATLEMAGLTGAPARAAATWLEAAEARLAAEAALRAFTGEAIRRLIETGEDAAPSAAEPSGSGAATPEVPSTEPAPSANDG